jgi:hypothetical protein
MSLHFFHILSVLAYAFLNLITSVEDVEHTVSQKAMCSELNTIGDFAYLIESAR